MDHWQHSPDGGVRGGCRSQAAAPSRTRLLALWRIPGQTHVRDLGRDEVSRALAMRWVGGGVSACRVWGVWRPVVRHATPRPLVGCYLLQSGIILPACDNLLAPRGRRY